MKYCVLLFVALLLRAQDNSHQEYAWRKYMVQGSEESAFWHLRLTLSKLYPVEHFMFSIVPTEQQPFAPNLCWKFYRPEVAVHERLLRSIMSYEGGVRWIVGPRFRGMTCIAAWPPAVLSSPDLRSPFVGFPPGDVENRPDPTMPTTAQRLPQPSEAFVREAIADIYPLTRYLEREFALEDLKPKVYDDKLIRDLEVPTAQNKLVDFIEPGMNVAWIMTNVPAEALNATKGRWKREKMLHFGITSEEWVVISTIVKESREVTSGKASFETLFPLLSRIKEYEGSTFSASEVEQLRRECLKLRNRTALLLAIRGLDKLIITCIWAESLHGGIYMAAP